MTAEVFPAYVGMSPSASAWVFTYHGVPRIRGDEPSGVHPGGFLGLCSPHTWG